MESDKCYHKSSSIVARKIADEMILVPIRQKVGDLQCMYILNEVGTRIWELFEDELTLADIASTIVSEYEVDPAQTEIDLTDFAAELESIEAITPS